MPFLIRLTKSYSPPEGGRIALSANKRTAEFLDFAIQAKFAYVNKLRKGNALSLFVSNTLTFCELRRRCRQVQPAFDPNFKSGKAKNLRFLVGALGDNVP